MQIIVNFVFFFFPMRYAIQRNGTVWEYYDQPVWQESGKQNGIVCFLCSHLVQICIIAFLSSIFTLIYRVWATNGYNPICMRINLSYKLWWCPLLRISNTTTAKHTPDGKRKTCSEGGWGEHTVPINDMQFIHIKWALNPNKCNFAAAAILTCCFIYNAFSAAWIVTSDNNNNMK